MGGGIDIESLTGIGTGKATATGIIVGSGVCFGCDFFFLLHSLQEKRQIATPTIRDIPNIIVINFLLESFDEEHCCKL